MLPAMLVLAALSAGAAAQVYRTVDEHGNVIYSDRPQPGSEELKGVGVQTVENPPAPAVQRPPTPPQAQPYTDIVITAPESGATLRDNTGNVQVSAALTPGLQSGFGHRAQLYVDGVPHGEPGAGLAWTLSNVDRGSHTLRLAIVDPDGREVAASAATTFQLHRTIKKKAQPKAPVTPPPRPAPRPAAASGKP